MRIAVVADRQHFPQSQIADAGVVVNAPIYYPRRDAEVYLLVTRAPDCNGDGLFYSSFAPPRPARSAASILALSLFVSP